MIRAPALFGSAMWALIQGASRGLGRELVRQLHARGVQVIATCRDPSGVDLDVPTIPLDVTDEASIEAAAAAVAQHTERLHLLMNVAGVLHGDGFGPERRLAEVAPENLARAFAVNASGPLLVAKHFARFLQHDERAVLANVSARVGSITGHGRHRSLRAVSALRQAGEALFSRTCRAAVPEHRRPRRSQGQRTLHRLGRRHDPLVTNSR